MREKAYKCINSCGCAYLFSCVCCMKHTVCFWLCPVVLGHMCSACISVSLIRKSDVKYSTGVSVLPAFCTAQRLTNHSSDYHKVWYRCSWFPEDEPYYEIYATPSPLPSSWVNLSLFCMILLLRPSL